jgi:polyhydroxyalkanoate synthase subunit PhaE
MADKPNDFIDQYQAFVRQGVEAWAKQFDPGAAPVEAPSADIVGRLFAGLGGFGDWMRAFSSGESPAAPFAHGTPPFGQPGPAEGFAPFGYGPPPGAAPGSDGFDEWARVARETLSMPALGLTREQQEEQQALLRAWIDYAQQYARYQALLQRVQDRAGDTMRSQGMPTDADSLRTVYDRWVNFSEESYAQAAMSEEFREVYAALVNAQMHLKVLQQRQVERFAMQAGLPTRREVDSLGERLQAVRRELRQMQGLAVEVEALRAEVAALREVVGSGEKRSGASRKDVAAKAAPARGAASKVAEKKVAAKSAAPKKGAARKAVVKGASGKEASVKKTARGRAR